MALLRTEEIIVDVDITALPEVSIVNGLIVTTAVAPIDFGEGHLLFETSTCQVCLYKCLKTEERANGLCVYHAAKDESRKPHPVFGQYGWIEECGLKGTN
jgi:hypothetical protein